MIASTPSLYPHRTMLKSALSRQTNTKISRVTENTSYKHVVITINKFDSEYLYEHHRTRDNFVLLLTVVHTIQQYAVDSTPKQFKSCIIIYGAKCSAKTQKRNTIEKKHWPHPKISKQH